jgi:hypothetical protein
MLHRPNVTFYKAQKACQRSRGGVLTLAFQLNITSNNVNVLRSVKMHDLNINSYFYAHLGGQKKTRLMLTKAVL